MEGSSYLHFGIVNMITIWIMVLVGIGLWGLVRKIGNKDGNA